MEQNNNPEFTDFTKAVNRFKALQMGAYTQGIAFTMILTYQIISVVLKESFHRPIEGFTPTLLLILLVSLPLWKLLMWMGKKLDQKEYLVASITETLGIGTDTPQVSKEVIITVELNSRQKKQLSIIHWCSVIIQIIAIIYIIFCIGYVMINATPALSFIDIILFSLSCIGIIVFIKICYSILLGFIRFLIVYL